MKQLLIILLLFYCFTLPGRSQSKKELASGKVKSSTEWTTKTRDGKTVTYKSVYEEYDKKGYTILKMEYDEDGTLARKETTAYDKFQRVISETMYNAEKKTSGKKTYTYDAFNNKTKELEYDGNDRLLKKTAITYNKDGNKTLETTSDESGKVLKKVIYSYNSKKLKTSKQTVNSIKESESSKKWEYSYFLKDKK